MRIAFVTPSLALGGYEKVVVSYANELNRRGHQVDILCGFRQGDLIQTVEDGIRILDFQARARNFLSPLVKYLKTNQVDILYCGFRSYNCIGVLAKKMAKVNTMVYASQHGFETDNWLGRKLKGKLIKRADRLTAVTQTVAEYEAKQLNIDVNRFHLLNNPVFDGDRVIPKESHAWFEEEIPIIAVSGRMSWDKGKPFCIRILKELNQTMPVRMLVMGNGPEMDQCKQLAQSLQIEDKVDFMGYVNNPMGYVAECKLLLHTALIEGFGNIIVESLAVNTPVCTTNCTGPMYIIENGKYGVDLGSVEDENFVANAAQKILDVLQDKVTFDGLRERASAFEFKKATDMFLDLAEQN